MRNEGFFWVHILKERFPDDCILVDAHTELFKQEINISALFGFSTFIHQYKYSASLIDILFDVNQFFL